MNTVITIGRQFGSAGREIGEQVAKEFGIKYYDKELLSRAAKESGFCEEILGIDIACVLDLAALVTMIYLASFGGKTDFLIKEICFIA